MVDPVSSVKHIAEVALKIKQAVETVRKNKEDCLQIRRRVVNVSDVLSQLQERGNMDNSAISSALEELAETLGHAHTLVMACQEKHVVCLFCTATSLSKKLRRVNDDISDQLMVGIFAITLHVTVVLNQIHGDRVHEVVAPPPPAEPEPETLSMHEPLPPPKPLPPSKEFRPKPMVVPAPPPPTPPPEKTKPESMEIPLRSKGALPSPPQPRLSKRAPPNEDEPANSRMEPWSSHYFSFNMEVTQLPEEKLEPPPPHPLLLEPKPPPPEEQPDLKSPLQLQAGSRIEPWLCHYFSFDMEVTQLPKEKPEPPPPHPLLLEPEPPPPEEQPDLKSPLPLQDGGAPAMEYYSDHRFAPFREEKKESAKSSLSFPGIRKFRISELEIATNQFAQRIGEGGFSTVYKGVLRDGLEVAIRKQANGCPSRYDEMPKMHPLIHLCSMLEHKNIVKLLGYCHENRPMGIVGAKEEYLLLVEEYMTNGNLSNFIYGEQLDWSSRFQIIQGVTQGITYLHTHSEKRTVVHLDLKPDNILLDSDMNPKIGDFGLAKVLEDDEINASVCGTLGYMPPEYIVEGVISVKNDVYGFGVTLLETISGMSESGRGARHQASIEWAWNVRKSAEMNKLFDPSLCDESQLKDIKRCIEIGLLCTQNKPRDRPTMPEVVQMLLGKKKVPTPKQPGYIKRVRTVGRYKHM